MEDSSKEMIPLNEKDLEEVSGGSASEMALTPFKKNVSADAVPAENPDVKGSIGPIKAGGW